MPRLVRFGLTLALAALTALAFASLAPAQESGDTPDSGMEEAYDDGSATEEGSEDTGEETDGIDDGQGDFEVLEDDSRSNRADDDGQAAQEDTLAEDDSGESSQADDVDRNCDDFDTRREAQEYFEDQGGDETHNEDGLDPDGDGEACESLGAPTGGVDAGGGGTAPHPSASSSDPLPFALGGAALGLALAGGSLLMRRRRATA